MKHDWEYKKIGHICNIKTGKLDANASSPEGKFPFFTCSKDVLHIDSYSYDEECVLIAGNGDLNVKYYKGKFDAYQRTYIVSIKECVSDVSTLYLYRFFSKYIEHLRKVSIGGVIKYIKLNNLTDAIIPIPPLPIQEQIVSELDKVSEIIEKKKQQVKELDNLAQSIFYDMFGDPVENEKGWDVKVMGDIGNFQRGSGLSKKVLVVDGYPCILYGQIHTRFGAFTKKHLSCIPNELVHTAKIAHPNDLIIAITSEDVEGSCKSTAWLGNYDIAVGSDAAIFSHNQNSIYVSYYTKTKAFYNEKAKYARGFKVTHISTKEIATISIMLPPLPLQQSFAQKIEVIEKQKELINQSIKETQTLFDARMEYWFGE